MVKKMISGFDPKRVVELVSPNWWEKAFFNIEEETNGHNIAVRKGGKREKFKGITYINKLCTLPANCRIPIPVLKK